MKRPSKSLPKPQRVTLHDLARHAGVSRATVSLVLRKSPLVADRTRESVLEAVSALGYVYNRGAANLRTQRSHTIGVAINEITNPYFAELTAAIQRAFWDLGRTVFIANSEEDPARQDQFIATMREYNADGLAICPSQGTTRQTLKRLKDQGIPCVLISRNVAGCGLDYAGHANLEGMRMATEHLIELGHRRIAMIGGTDLISTGAERRKGYREALARHRIAIDEELIIPGPPTRSFGAATVKALLTNPNPPTAAVCFNDVIAFGVMLGLRQVGLEPGRDFAVMGYDDLAEAELWTPALSTVAIDSIGIGVAAAQLLLQRIEHPDAPPRRVVMQPKLVLRESSCPPRRT
ncbi:LacI family DNA-binding transcriptional regulator [Bradyrhizobium sp. U87765 SZCCT0131]|uniref:LacI family DNA-binding transcriptional regulator n=1 Tax=unclassified Bradyrhizobium TaxID=2631580 RepID=UPI001BA83DDD|nr:MULTISPECIES: LacI family DNA-binding transcriptional regulator [unclassified Bradyrhizobium]MBR1222535.1 LacI family DNA-binding transcriptional regulator [Bradyrhizobium sp. U87765 SZCCT0131]MBR1265384.1 LacI family DNA-binding transcriptional regulator [Bradyrhizobium sp. U87765 SZCCT0134]MBR1302837.1 LacI family DNA-binding transcriptional regulator [Bradyrhizobium sp. U87765 SZCCT0110]MBR1323535.1 LacI family DNA-binding transcriptional regulator [Bradyrhizobium sp. U87765 SZCCT0109]MB